MKKILLNGLMSSVGIVVGTCLILNEGMTGESTGEGAVDTGATDEAAAKNKTEAEKEASSKAGPAVTAAEVKGPLPSPETVFPGTASTETTAPVVPAPVVPAPVVPAPVVPAPVVPAPVVPAPVVLAPKTAVDAGGSVGYGSSSTATASNINKTKIKNVMPSPYGSDATERARLEREAATSTTSIPVTTASTTPIIALSEEEEEAHLNKVLNKEYVKILSDIKGKLSSCSSRSDCLDKSKIVFKNTLESLGAKSGYGSSSYSSYSSTAKPDLPAEPTLKDSVKYIKGRYSMKTGETDSEFSQRLRQEINNNYEDKIEEYEKKKKEYMDKITKWRNQILRDKSKKMVENFQTFLQSVYDKDIFPTQILIYEHLSQSGKNDYLAHRLVTDPLKVRIYADETTQTTGKKKSDDGKWAQFGAGAIGTILGGMLGSSPPPTSQRPGQRPATPQQGYQSPYATPKSATPQTGYQSPYATPKSGTQPPKPAQRSTTPGGYNSTPARPQVAQKSQAYQSPQAYKGYQNNSYSVGEEAAFIQPIVFGEANGYDYSYGNKKSYGSSSSSYGNSYSSSSAPAGKKEIPPKEYRFNKDDVLLFVMDEIEKKHRNCSNHKDCLKQDMDRVAAIANGLGEKDPSRDVLLEIADEIEARANTSYVGIDKIIKAFEENAYESGGSPLKSKLREEWESIANKRSKSRTSRDAKVINEVELKKAHAKVIKVEEKKAEKKRGYSQQGKQQEPAKKDEGGLMGLFGKLFGG